MSLEYGEGFVNFGWEGPSELPERRSSSSALRRGSAEPRPRGCSGLGEKGKHRSQLLLCFPHKVKQGRGNSLALTSLNNVGGL